MKKNLGAVGVVTPLPVLIIATYDENGVADAMNVAWGGQCGPKHVALNLSPVHKTNENLKLRKAFTVSFATADDVVESDYFGIVSAKKERDKIGKAQMHVRRAEHVDAPIIEEYPLTLECKMVELATTFLGEERVVGEIVNVVADENILNADGKIDLSKWKPIMFDSAQNYYRVVGDVVGNAFKDGSKLK